MKTKIQLIACLSLLSIFFTQTGILAGEIKGEPNVPALRIACTPEIVRLGEQWITLYNQTNPEVPLQIVSSDEPAAESILLTTKKQENLLEGQREILLGKRVIVPIIRSTNPFMTQLRVNGVSLSRLAALGTQSEWQWGQLIGGGQKQTLTVYIQDDQPVNQSVLRLLNMDQASARGVITGDLPTILNKLENDPAGIAFVNLSAVTSPGVNALPGGLSFLPIDKNNNGNLDYAEKIFATPADLLRGIWIGKYPRTLVQNVYAITGAMPDEKTQAALNWILTNGQPLLHQEGYIALSENEIQAQTELLTLNASPTVNQKDAGTQSGIALLILAGLCLGLILVLFVVRKIRDRAFIAVNQPDAEPSVFNEESLAIPKGLYYDKTHTWVFREKDGNIRVGIDDFLQHLTGKLNRIQLKAPGEKVKKGELLLSLRQNGKLLTIFSPVSGIIREQNENLENQLYTINSDPYGAGWMYTIEPTNWNNEVLLLDVAEKYGRWIKTEFSRFKDFIAGSSTGNATPAYVILQDGGTFQNGVLGNFGPEVWEDFQAEFLNTHKQA